MGSSSLDELTKQKLAAEVSESIASKMRTDAETAKLVAEARNLQLQNAVLAKEQQKTRLPWSTTEFTVVLGLLGFIAGSAEFAWTAWQNRIAAREALTANEAKEWRSAVASVDYLGEAKSVGGALTLATYYEDPAHARDARSLVASILPTIKNNDEFDHVFNGLYRNTRWVDDDDPQIYTVAKAVRSNMASWPMDFRFTGILPCRSPLRRDFKQSSRL
jgi:hypothetical protein